LKLPNLKQTYREAPAHGIQQRAAKKKEVVPQKKMCGLCGNMHVPGEPHITKKASQFNAQTGTIGISRVGGGFGYTAV
jgi:hypothetical protein